MALYSIGRKVLVKFLEDEPGEIIDAHYSYDGFRRTAEYLVLLDRPSRTNAGIEITCTSKGVKPYDGYCDCCNKPRRDSQLIPQYARISEDDYEHVVTYCWYCLNVTYKDDWRRY